MAPHNVDSTGRSVGLAVIGILISVIVAVAMLELGMRSFVQPSERGYGRLFGVELPPLQIVKASKLRSFDGSAELAVTAAGEQITGGDLWGHWAYDPIVGYRQQIDVRSANGWW